MYIDAIKVMLYKLDDRNAAQNWAETHGDEERDVWKELGAYEL